MATRSTKVGNSKHRYLPIDLWNQSEKRLVQWLTYEMDENPHLRRVLQKYSQSSQTSKIKFAQ